MAKNNNLTDFLTGVANAIRTKKGTSGLINPQDFESEIRTIQTGTDTSDATAVADDIRLGKTAYGADGKMTGTIADYDGTSEPASGKSLAAQIVDKSVTSVSEEDLNGITTIGDYAFYNCSGLTSITIPDSVTNIGLYAFSYCGKLTSITIPNGVTSIGVSVFSYCGNLTSVIIGNGVTIIDNSVFYFCGAATESGTTYMILATTPPTIQSNTFGNAKINKIIVPKGTLAAYKSATNWVALANKIEEATE